MANKIGIKLHLTCPSDSQNGTCHSILEKLRQLFTAFRIKCTLLSTVSKAFTITKCHSTYSNHWTLTSQRLHKEVFLIQKHLGVPCAGSTLPKRQRRPVYLPSNGLLLSLCAAKAIQCSSNNTVNLCR